MRTDTRKVLLGTNSGWAGPLRIVILTTSWNLRGADWKVGSEDVDLNWNHWKRIFTGILDYHAPVVRCRVRKDALPWIDKDIRKLMRRRNRLRKLACASGDSGMWESYRCLCNKVTAALRAGKRRYFLSLCCNTAKSTKNTWRELNKLLGRSRHGSPSICIKGCPDLAKGFSDHFSSASPTTADLPPPNFPELDCSFQFRPIEEVDVFAALSRLQVSEASGVDGIRASILRVTAPAIARSLCHLFNLSLHSGVVPREWKAAKIIPVPKSKAKGGVSFGDFRPISVLPIIAKVFESLVHSQVCDYLQHHGILHHAQSGFRPKHSTQDVLLKTVDDWRFSLSRNEVVGAVFVDLSKAFDSIGHELLLQKLDCYGFRGTPLEWFRSFLTGRKQRVVVGGEESQWFDLHSGVPQGSILGPILFSLFVNDLPVSLTRSEVMLYADDTTIYLSDTNTLSLKERLSQDLVALSTWIADNGLTMNTQKTQFMVLSKRGRDKEVEKLQIKVNGEVLRKCDNVKFLGVIVDHQLSWRDHVEAVRRKCLGGLAQLHKVKDALPTRLRKLLYQSLILPHLDYCAVVWAECSKGDADKVQRLQNRGMRLILGKKWDHHSKDLRTELGWMTLTQRRRMFRSRVVRRYLTGDCPAYARRMFKTIQELGLRSARRGEDLRLPTPRCSLISRSFQYRAGLEWNAIPLAIRQAHPNRFNHDLCMFYMD